MAVMQGRLHRADELYAQGLEQIAAAGHPPRIVSAYRESMAMAARMHGRDELLERLATDGLRRARELGDVQHIGMNLEHLAWVAWRRGDDDEARRLGAEAVEHYRACAHPASIAAGLESLAAFVVGDDPERAARLLGTAERARSTTSEPRAPVHDPAWRTARDAARDALGEERFGTAFAAGDRDG